VTTPTISVIITTHNEGPELAKTIRSVKANTWRLAKVIVVDDGSDDGSTLDLPSEGILVIRHDQRIGVARSRDEGSRAARGDVLCYLDAHQRVSRLCLDRCAKLAIERQAITCPDIRDFGLLNWRMHGADFRMCPNQGYFSARWRHAIQLPGVSAVTALRAPPYLLPRSMYADVAWSPLLRGWGASESSTVLKSFFLGIEILHIAGPLARHRFREAFQYETTWEGIWSNHAMIARICFDDATWFRYWLPRVFEPHLTAEARQLLESHAVQVEREAFAKKKVREDRQFWTELLQTSPPVDV